MSICGDLRRVDRGEYITASRFLDGLVNLTLVSYSAFPGVISGAVLSGLTPSISMAKLASTDRTMIDLLPVFS